VSQSGERVFCVIVTQPRRPESRYSRPMSPGERPGLRLEFIPHSMRGRSDGSQVMAFFLLLTAYCLLLTAYCLLFVLLTLLT